MKYSFMTFSTPELPLRKVIALAVKYGYDGIEPRVSAGHQHGLEFDTPAQAREEAKALAADNGIAFACVATSCRFADPATNVQNREDALQAIRLAADLGAACIRVFGGQIPAGMSREDAKALIVDSLCAIAPQAAAHNVTVCLETHDDWRDPYQVADIMRQVNHPAIAVNWDIMHPIYGGYATIDESFTALKPWIRHLHVHDGPGESDPTLLPIGQGIVDHQHALELLLQCGYQDYISGEWIGWESAELHLPRELATLKRYEAELALTIG